MSLLMILFFNNIFSQTIGPKNRIGISVPLVWNHSESGLESNTLDGNRGKALSNGVNIHYMHSLSKSFFVMTGIGYFTQHFNIRRYFIFNYDQPIWFDIFYQTLKYSYATIPVSSGVAYQKMLNDRWGLSGQLTYNIYSSFSQKYLSASGEVDSYKRYLHLGDMIHLDIGISKDIFQRISIRVGLLMPLLVRWHEDEIFAKPYEPTQKAAQNIFSAGISFSCYYSF